MNILFWLFIGIVLGILAGLLPGLHTNTIIFLILPLYFSLGIEIISFLSFVIGISITNTFVNFLPSILIGVPETDTALSVLPGHKYALQGKGFEAIKLTVFGGVISSIFSILFLPLLFLIIPLIYPLLQEVMHFLLIGLLLFMLWRDKKTLFPLAIIALSGVLGIITLNSNIVNSQYILLPVFTGLFGVSTIIISIFQDVELPPQEEKGEIKNKDWKSGFKGFISGVLAGIFPGLGSSQSVLLLKEVFDMDLREFITSQGGVNTSAIFFSILSLYLIGKARSGAAIALQRIIGTIDLNLVLLMVGISMLCIAIASLLTLILGKIVAGSINKVDYKKLLVFVLIFLFAGVYYLTGFFGIIILLTSTSIGLTAVLSSTRRSYCMSVLIIPTIIYYLGFSSVLSGII